MAVAREFYESDGWKVQDVSARKSYDLLCTQTGKTLHVEVKGTASTGEGVINTRNEVAFMRSEYPATALVVYVTRTRSNYYLGSMESAPREADYTACKRCCPRLRASECPGRTVSF